MPNTTTFDSDKSRFCRTRDLRISNALLLTRAALFAAWDVIGTQGGAYADALPTAKRQYEETMSLMAEDDTDDDDDYEAGEC